ncbi:Serine hydroxymethyltransferase [Candidatus Clavichlamydia salmonicola]|uniref:serine hydroxymethyltransferase n=1 Tax=Candidatus Clavichlamydia salmonicola TaxID=469812 RepID=UPI001890FBA6|nr:serine hydroxymethyltransferase [Candidatus Clavichlamydia salmonicola]MBF5051069.1 Serine hydroxymethyltransferase [Candidatus Clavichlamydia salmonicola]
MVSDNISEECAIYKTKTKKNLAAAAYAASLAYLSQAYPSVGSKIIQELKDQRTHLKLIPSENYSSYAVQLAMGNWLSDKYCEGYAFNRFYGGCGNIDAIEWEAEESLKELFGAEHANIQAHSGCDANLLAISIILSKKVQDPFLFEMGAKGINSLSESQCEELRLRWTGQSCLGMNMTAGGHLTHGGVRLSLVSRILRTFTYGCNLSTGYIDYDEIASKAKKLKPLIIIGGYSAYPRRIDFAKMKQIAEDNGAVLMADMAHFAGLVAGKVFQGNENPVPFADVVTSTTHKTLRGPRGGMLLCKKEYAEWANKSCPLVWGGPLPHVMAAKLICFKEAAAYSFQNYAYKIVENAKALAERLKMHGMPLVTNGTDNHLILVDVSSLGLTGKAAQVILQQAGIVVNANTLPKDPPLGWVTSGIRIGTPALTTLGMGIDEMNEVADIIFKILSETQMVTEVSGKKEPKIANEKILKEAKSRIKALLKKHPLYPEIDLTELSPS